MIKICEFLVKNVPLTQVFLVIFSIEVIPFP